MKKVFLDNDIILDLLFNREPFNSFATTIFDKIANDKLDGYISSLIVANTYYILNNNLNRKIVKEKINKLLILVEVLSVDKKIIEYALNSDFKDFEDGVQYYTALFNKIPILITRNIKDYKNAKDIEIISSEEFSKIISKK